jgi:uncharacterized delta-60 repeat protein
MKTPLLLSCIIFFCILSTQVNAQLQKVDTTFTLGIPNSTVRQVDIQKSGKLILTGEFNVFNGGLANRIVRLQSNGLMDSAFQSGFGASGPVRATALYPNDYLLLGGLFSSYNGTSRGNIARVNIDGVLDTSFARGIGANNEITATYLQRDGKILIAGFFSKYNNVNVNGFTRLDSVGNIDTTFKKGTGPNSSPFDFAQQSSNKLILVGSFLNYNGVPRNKIVRVNLDGSLDTTFKNNSISSSIQKVFILNNDDIIITGGFTNIDGVTKTGIAKLSKDGKLDTAFKAYILGTVRAIHQQRDGKIIVAGDFTNVNGVVVQRLVRFNINGTLDNTIYAGLNGSVYDIAERDKNIYLVGAFTLTTQVPNITKGSPKYVKLLNTYCIAPTKPEFLKTNSHECRGDSVTINITGGQLNDALNWYWHIDSCGGAVVDSGASITIPVQSSFSLFVRAEKGCTTFIGPCARYDIIMNDTIVTEVKYTSNGVESQAFNTTFQWYRCDSTWQILPGETEGVLIPKNSGSYAVVLTSIDGCVDTTDCYPFVMPVGFNQTKRLGIQNPVGHTLVLPPHLNLTEMILYNTLGQVVFQKNNLGLASVLDLAYLEAGVYILWAKDHNGNQYQERILLRK